MDREFHRLFLVVLSLFAVCTMTGQVICKGKQVVLVEDGFCNIAPYHLIFEDNFNGNLLDTSLWIYGEGVLRDINHNHTQQWLARNNSIVENGLLRLRANDTVLENQCYNIWIDNGVQTFCEDFSYAAGEIRTKKKFSHGLFEISCKLPKGKGLGMAFWTYGYEHQNEIDVFEFESEKNIFGKHDADKYSRVHRMNSRTDYENDGSIEDCSSKYKGPDFSGGFHVFSVLWTPHKLEWYVDGELKRTSYLFYDISGKGVDCNGLKEGHQYIKNRAFPLDPMEVYISLGVFSGSNAPDDSTVLPAYFEIEYFRFYSQN